MIFKFSAPEMNEKKYSNERLNHLNLLDLKNIFAPHLFQQSNNTPPIETSGDDKDEFLESDASISSSFSSSDADESLASSSDWETDEDGELERQDEILRPKPAFFQSPEEQKEEDGDNFGYVPLRTRIPLEEEGNVIRRKRNRRVSWKDRQKSSKFRQFWEEGGDLSNLPIPIPFINFNEGEEKEAEMDDDPLEGMKSIGKILNNPELTISQKYKSLGVEEEEILPEDEDDQAPCSCWTWIKYKISKLYDAQWPLLVHLYLHKDKDKIPPPPNESPSE